MMAAGEKSDRKKMPDGRDIREILRYLSEVTGRLKINIVILSIISAADGIIGVLYALAFRDMINTAVDGELQEFLGAVVSFVVLIILQLLLTLVSRTLRAYTRTSLVNRIRDRLFSTILCRDYGSVTSVHSGEWMNRFTTDTSELAGSLLNFLPNLVGTLVRLAALITAITILEPRFLIFVIPGGTLLAVVSYALRGVLKNLKKETREKDGKVRAFIQDAINSLIILRSYGVEEDAENEASRRMKDYQNAHMRQNIFSSLFNTGYSAVLNCAYIFVAIFCGYGILSRTMSYGTFVALLQLFSMISGPISNLSEFIPEYYAMIVNIERLMDAEDLPEGDEEEPLDPAAIGKIYKERFESIGFRSVRFRYPKSGKSGEDPSPAMPLIFDGLNFETDRGDYVALVGKSGCGKSTLLKLIMCLYPPDSGERYILFSKSKDVKDAENDVSGHDEGHMGSDGDMTGNCPGTVIEPITSKYKNLFAYVPQGDTFMSGTIREIVAFSDREAMYDDERINDAIKTACADDFVYKMENGVDTEIGERGLGLSEGQLQRLSIARAIFSERPILLLDECTSALDEETERRLLGNLKTMTDRTVFIVTHRKAALDICDKIIRFSPEGNVTIENVKHVSCDDEVKTGKYEKPDKNIVPETEKEDPYD